MKIELPFEKVANSPVFWLKKISLFSKPSLDAEIRSITFHRGLNIIWGKSVEENPEELHPVLLTGHSVGKTTLCRMIRYCFGEDHFGTPAVESLIRNKFPEGLVAAEILLNTELYLVLRTFSPPNISIAEKEHTLGYLFDNWKKVNKRSFKPFIEEMEKSTIIHWPSRKTPDGKKNLECNHLLAWLTRDQETRFQSLWEWRSTRSESGVAQLNKPYAEYLLRLVLELV
ncbi:MAG TPA: hypothetical protein VHO72_12250, partial [Bacteroidales bacterium]|nr:hypothetical protein [Bacteroidales bacterium]